jgi:hypothetical protein
VEKVLVGECSLEENGGNAEKIRVVHLFLWKMIVVTRSEREETQEVKIKRAISISTHP